MKNRQLKAKGIVKWWGNFRYIATHITFYSTILILAMTATTAYNTTIKLWMKVYLGVDLQYYIFILLIVIFVLGAVIFEWKVTLPGYFRVFNEQMYKHDNPIRRDLELIKKKLNIMEETNADKESGTLSGRKSKKR